MRHTGISRFQSGMFYLNNRGSRWVTYSDGKKPKYKVNHEDTEIIRTAIEFRAWGNFASMQYSYKGKKYETLNYERYE